VEAKDKEGEATGEINTETGFLEQSR